jgi:hypothetical protein
MNCGISEQKWLDFIENGLDLEDRLTIQAHLDVCPACRTLCSQMRAWGAAMEREAVRLRQAAARSESETDRMLAQALERIQAAKPVDAGPSRVWSVPEALALLRALLAPFCGIGTARASLRLAAQAADLDVEDPIPAGNWAPFVSNLSQMISLQCGIATGRLVGRVGICLGGGEG